MNDLITITPAPEVTDEYKKEAKTWTKWDSKNKKSFPYNYTTEERILILAGSATITPSDGGDPLTIEAGDAVTFHKGFKCRWKITKRMKKHYGMFASDEDEDADEPPAITCDVCGEGCFEESYFVKEDESDICPKCYVKDEKKYALADHQKNGEAVIEKNPPKKKQKKG
mmetsp:Transcript_33020/g.49868  ORF Transcript_33020/g.49868 Transcript_33020/m.49868 type:complete len:169 (-) Transcript_33020:272-778(-)